MSSRKLPSNETITIIDSDQFPTDDNVIKNFSYPSKDSIFYCDASEDEEEMGRDDISADDNDITKPSHLVHRALVGCGVARSLKQYEAIVNFLKMSSFSPFFFIWKSVSFTRT